MEYLSDRLKEYRDLILCSVEGGAWPEIPRILFPCYNQRGEIGIDEVDGHHDFVDEEKGLCGAELLKVDGDVALVNINMRSFRVPRASLVTNLG
jgi:hypothetical protein